MFALFNKLEKYDNRIKNITTNEEILDSLSDIGLNRSNNEDSVVTLIHPNNQNLKLLAVADGVGGRESGEVASNFTISVLEKWFYNLPEETINNTKKLSKYLTNIIKCINNCLYVIKSYRTGCATTLTCAVINERKTIIANVGDSRAYIVKENNLHQVTKDDSLVWNYFEQGELTKEEIRFHKARSLITKCIGSDYNTKPDIILLDNSSYDGILLFTDGVTDCLSDSKIEKLVTSKKQNLAQKISKEAVYGKPSKKIPKGEAFSVPKNGKDNATVALYFKGNEYI